MSESTDHTLRSALAAAALLGRGSDSMLAHISPREAKMLRESGGSGARNPVTGLLEFDGGGDNATGGSGNQGGFPVWQNSITNAPASGGGPDFLTSTSPSGFAPVAAGASVPDYVSQYMSGQYGGLLSGQGLNTNQGSLGTFDVNGQTNYGWQFPGGVFAPAFLPTSGETNTSLDAQQQSALYPAPLAGETQQNQTGLPIAWTDTNNVLTPTAGTLSDAAYNLPGYSRALADTKPDPWAMLGLLGPAIAAGPVIGGAIAGLEAGALGAGVAGAGVADASAATLGFGDVAAGAGAAGAGAADAAPGLFDLSTLLGTSPDVATGLTTGDFGALAGGAGAAGAGAAAPDLFNLDTLLGTDPTTTAALTGGNLTPTELSGLAGLSDTGTSGFATAANLGGDNSFVLGAADQAPSSVASSPFINAAGDVNLAAPGLLDPTTSGLLGISGPTEIPGFSAADTGSGGFFSGVGNAFSDVADPVNKFVNSNSGLFKALGLGASALSLGGDLMKGNQGVTGLTGGSQLNALAGQLATPGGINPAQTAALTNLQGQATTQNQPQVQNLTALQGQAQQSGQTLQNYLTTGTLPPAVQAQVDQATQSAITAIKAGYASRGIPANSSMEIQDINTAKQSATAQAAQLMQNLSTQGLSEQQLAATIGQQIASTNTQGTQLAAQIGSQLVGQGLQGAGISEQIYQTLLQADQTQQAQTGQAIANLARALSGGTTIQLGGTTAK